jgi:prepilin-type N-terminal cleavage/methylation domain-containing protein
MRSDRCGFTLLEVVLAIALLSAITVAALPLLVEATRSSVPPVAVVETSELGAFADDAMRDEATVARISERSAVRLAWRDAPMRSAVVARRLGAATTTDGSLPHDWIEFTCGNARVLRYWRIDEKPADAGEPPP